MQKGGITAPWNVNVPHLSDTDSMKYVAGVFGRTGVQQEANARLIAQSPTMYDFLWMIANGGINEAGEAQIESEARAILSKINNTSADL